MGIKTIKCIWKFGELMNNDRKEGTKKSGNFVLNLFIYLFVY